MSEVTVKISVRTFWQEFSARGERCAGCRGRTYGSGARLMMAISEDDPSPVGAVVCLGCAEEAGIEVEKVEGE